VMSQRNGSGPIDHEPFRGLLHGVIAGLGRRQMLPP
jgi:hypothetical protein